MKKAPKTTRLMILFALLASLMATSATEAQASYWLVSGATIPVALQPVVFSGFTDNVLEILSKIGLTKLGILCSESKWVGAQLETEGKLSGKAHLQGCITKLNGSAAASCKPKSPGASLGLIETNALKGSLVASGGETLLEVVPVVGENFAELELGASCAIGNKLTIKGKLFVKDCNGEMLVDKVKHLFEEGPLSSVFIGSNPATIDGSEIWLLEGAHTGKTFAGHN